MLLVLLTTILAQPAEARPVALEIRAGAHDPGAGQLLEEIARTEASDRGPALSQRLETALEPPGGDLDAAEIARVRREIDAGIDAFLNGRLDETVRLLGAVSGRRDRLLGGDSKDTRLRALLFRGEITLALALQRSGRDAQATDVAIVAARDFPEIEPSRREQGPEAVALVTRVRDRLRKGLTGVLRVETTPPGAPVLVSGRFAGVSPVELRDLPSGPYLVEARGPRGRGRLHRVNVATGTAEVRIDAGLEDALELGASPALVVPAGTSPESEAQLAAHLGKRLGTDVVYLAGVRPDPKGAILFATRVAVGAARAERWAGVRLGAAGPTREQLSAIARAVTLGTRDPMLLPAPGALVTADVPAGPPVRWYQDTLGWVLVGAGAAACGGSLVFFSSAGDSADAAERQTRIEDRQRFRNDADSSRMLGYLTVGLGAAAVVGGVVKLALVPDERQAARRRWIALPATDGTLGAVVIGRF